ncbi:hypothetical protein A1O7_06932 [Cladophialophora yegresii CBS 114405]|uniref:Uncharacterized protein n=1 Tax=Cladophialophora yegresii CBS 114405 TaxID=1182544 RepID=W9VM44_9EURO|nr:uncharacterized protein A1O7_06932 [Cladophialophora yegresii CBS 114405]EXJ56588.1 hypothetical protein A1O7_06932 [Cladophialophora yegresii CBS 114405]
MSDENSWTESRTRSPSVVPDEGIRGFLEEKTANLFATQLQSRLTTLEQTKETPKFLRRNSYALYLEGHFALLDPRELQRTSLSPTPPSSDDDWTSAARTPEPHFKASTSKVCPDESLYTRLRTRQGRIERKRQRRRQDKISHRMAHKHSHRMLRRSKHKSNALFYELDWIGRNAVAVCQMTADYSQSSNKKG